MIRFTAVVAAVFLCAGVAHGASLWEITDNGYAVSPDPATEHARSTAEMIDGPMGQRSASHFRVETRHWLSGESDVGDTTWAEGYVDFTWGIDQRYQILNWMRKSWQATESDTFFEMNLIANPGTDEEFVVNSLASDRTFAYNNHSFMGFLPAGDYRLEYFSSVTRTGFTGEDIDAYGDIKVIMLPTPAAYGGGLFLLAVLGGVRWWRGRRYLRAA